MHRLHKHHSSARTRSLPIARLLSGKHANAPLPLGQTKADRTIDDRTTVQLMVPDSTTRNERLATLDTVTWESVTFPLDAKGLLVKLYSSLQGKVSVDHGANPRTVVW